MSEHEPWLRFVTAAGLASIGAMTGFCLHRRSCVHVGPARLAWSAGAALASVLSVWAARFVVEPPFRCEGICGRPFATAGSFAVMVCAVACGFAIGRSDWVGPWRRAGTCLLLGLGLCGSSAIELPMATGAATAPIGLWVILAQIGCATVFWLGLSLLPRRRDRRPRLARAIAIGICLAVIAELDPLPPIGMMAVGQELSLFWTGGALLALVLSLFGVGLAASAVDRRFRLLAEREVALVRKGEHTLRSLLDQLPFGIAVAEVATGEVVIVNREARRVLGETADARGPLSYPLTRALLYRERVESELHAWEGPEGAAVTLEISAAPVFDGTGAQILAISAFQDVSARLRAEAELRQAQKMEALGLLTGGVAHDTNNLLTAILGNLDLLERRLVDETSRTLLRNALGATERGARLTAQLLGFSRRQALAAQAVDVNATVGGMVGLLQSTLGGAVEVALELDPAAWTALADPTQLELMLLNLALNARDAMPTGGRITARTENVRFSGRTEATEPVPGEYVLLTVRDEGVGMDAATLGRAFEPFFSTKAPGRGSGLGLSQVLGIAQQLGGGVRIASEPGRGTSVTLFLPRSPDGVVSGVVEQRDGGSAAFRGRSILLVDDDPDVRIAARALLGQLGFAVSEEANGAAAVARIAAGLQVDAVLMDYAMPGINGAEAASQIRAIRPRMPILLITGYAEPHRLSGIEGRFPVLQKPFRSAGLSEALAGIVAPGEPDGVVVPLSGRRA